MADDSAGEKSEKASAQKKRKAREEGEIARSKDISLAGSLFAAFFVVSTSMPHYRDFIREAFVSLNQYSQHIVDPGIIAQFLKYNVLIFLKFIVTLIPIPLAASAVSLIPGGWIFTPKKLLPNFGKLNPITGIGRLFSAQHLVETLKMMFKSIIMLALLYHMVSSYLPDYLAMQSLFFKQAVSHSLSLYRDVMFNFVMLIGFFAVVDLPISKYMFNKKLRMTKQEQKDEYKNSEGKPEVKSRIRQLQRQVAMGQIRRTVPGADVVITNPTHFAVALKYDHSRAAAPYVVAKGSDETALYIRQVAKENQIEVVEFPKLARAVYYTTQVNQQIPSQLYRAIAHVLTYVLQLKTWRAGNNAPRPQLNRFMTIPKEVLKQDAEND